MWLQTTQKDGNSRLVVWLQTTQKDGNSSFVMWLLCTSPHERTGIRKVQCSLYITTRKGRNTSDVAALYSPRERTGMLVECCGYFEHHHTKGRWHWFSGVAALYITARKDDGTGLVVWLHCTSPHERTVALVHWCGCIVHHRTKGRWHCFSGVAAL